MLFEVFLTDLKKTWCSANKRSSQKIVISRPKSELQRIVNMDRIPNIFVLEILMVTEYQIIGFLKIA